MGRWAQRTRGGGGINTPLFMVSASVDDDAHITVTYNRLPTAAINSSGFSFSAAPSGAFADSATVTGPLTLQLHFNGDVTADTTLTYHGTYALALFPQTIAIT